VKENLHKARLFRRKVSIKGKALNSSASSGEDASARAGDSEIISGDPARTPPQEGAAPKPALECVQIPELKFGELTEMLAKIQQGFYPA
jgi:hypothetical protein